MSYFYLGDKLTRPELRGCRCDAVRDSRGKCIIGRKPRNQLVRWLDGPDAGELCIVLARRLRKDE